MADADTIVALVLGLLGGGGVVGAVSAYLLWRQGSREQAQVVWESYREQIKLAGARGDDDEAKRLSREWEEQLDAWRAQQGLANVAPRQIRAGTGQPSLSEQEIDQLRKLLAGSAPLLPVLLSADAYFLRGNAHYEAGQYDEALAAYNRSLELRPDDAATLMNRGGALDGLGRHEEALADYNRSLDLRPDHPDTLMGRGAALHGLGRYEEALADYNRSLELRPDDPGTLSNRGVALANLTRHKEALADYNRSLELRPDDAATLRTGAGRLTAWVGTRRHWRTTTARWT